MTTQEQHLHGHQKERGRPRETWRTAERERTEMGWKDWMTAKRVSKDRTQEISVAHLMFHKEQRVGRYIKI